MKWKSLFCLPLLALLLLACGGCQPKSAILLQGKELASWEDLYGQDIDAVAGTLGVELSYSEVRNVWNLPEPVLFEEMEFTQQLLFEADTNTLFGVRYAYQGPVEDLSAFVDGLLSQFTKAYGQAITYPETKYRLSDDAFKAAAIASVDQWEMFLYPWREEWPASENTVCCLSVQPVPGRRDIELDYTMVSEEPIFHIQGDYPDFIRIQRNHIADEDYKDFFPQDKEYQEIIELLNGLQYRRKEVLELESGGGGFMYAVEFMYEKDNPYEEDKNASPYCRLCYEFTNENILVDHVMYYCDPEALAQLRAYLGT